MMDPPATGQELFFDLDAEVVRNECRWTCRSVQGEPLLLAQLLPELAQDESLRRRYVYEAERLASVSAIQLAETLEVGPSPDPRDPKGIAPWRLRREPEGQRLDRWLRNRAPVPVDEALELLKTLARAVHALHLQGLVLRDLEPRSVVMAGNGTVTVTDVGLARVDILSSRTASSLMLESSAYAAPEHLRATVVDARADVYTLAAIAWQALTGVLPYDEDSPFLRDYKALPALESMVLEAPKGLDSVLRACLSENADDRPKSAEQIVDILEGRAVQGFSGVERTPCQACGALLRPALRLCLECGKAAVQFHSAKVGEPGYSIYLNKANETPEFHAKLQSFFVDVAQGPPPALNFLVGDARMYSREEQKARIALPAPLLTGLSKDTVDALTTRLSGDGLNVKTRKGDLRSKRAREGRRFLIVGGAMSLTGTGAALAFGMPFLAIMGVMTGLFVCTIGAVKTFRARKLTTHALAELREAPIALPASDPLIIRLAGLLGDALRADVREQVSGLALLVQRLSDHLGRASVESEAGLFLKPLESLVTLVCETVDAIAAIDTELDDLDEGHLMRAIHASHARDEDSHNREGFQAGLDRLRDLEEQRSSHMGELLQAAALLERVVEMGLNQGDEAMLESNRITMALASVATD